MASSLACAELLPGKGENGVRIYRQWGIYLAIVGMLWIGGSILIYRNVYQNRETRTLIEYSRLPELATLITDTAQLENIVLFPDDEGVGNLYYLLGKVPPHFWVMNYPWFRNDYEVGRWLTEMDRTEPEQVIYFTSRGPQQYPEMDAYISESYKTIHVLEWNNQVVEIKERISKISFEN
jgi:hypothetical protein